jgi:hypothetical protein
MAGTQAKFATIEQWCAISGMGRTSVYQAIASGQLRGRKLGKRRVLIDVEHGLRWIRSLPAPNIRLANSRTDAFVDA